MYKLFKSDTSLSFQDGCFYILTDTWFHWSNWECMPNWLTCVCLPSGSSCIVTESMAANSNAHIHEDFKESHIKSALNDWLLIDDWLACHSRLLIMIYKPTPITCPDIVLNNLNAHMMTMNLFHYKGQQRSQLNGLCL